MFFVIISQESVPFRLISYEIVRFSKMVLIRSKLNQNYKLLVSFFFQLHFAQK